MPSDGVLPGPAKAESVRAIPATTTSRGRAISTSRRVGARSSRRRTGRDWHKRGESLDAPGTVGPTGGRFDRLPRPMSTIQGDSDGIYHDQDQHGRRPHHERAHERTIFPTTGLGFTGARDTVSESVAFPQGLAIVRSPGP